MWLKRLLKVRIMDTTQKTIVKALRYLAQCVEDGKYGEGDDLDAEVFLEDLDENVGDIEDSLNG